MPKFNVEKNLDHGILFTTAETKLPTKSETLENDAQKLRKKYYKIISFDWSRCVTIMSNENIIKCAEKKNNALPTR